MSKKSERVLKLKKKIAEMRVELSVLESELEQLESPEFDVFKDKDIPPYFREQPERKRGLCDACGKKHDLVHTKMGYVCVVCMLNLGIESI